MLIINFTISKKMAEEEKAEVSSSNLENSGSSGSGKAPLFQEEYSDFFDKFAVKNLDTGKGTLRTVEHFHSPLS